MIGMKKRDNIATLGMKKRNPTILGQKKRSMVAMSPMGALGEHTTSPAQQKSVLERINRTQNYGGKYA